MLSPSDFETRPNSWPQTPQIMTPAQYRSRQFSIPEHVSKKERNDELKHIIITGLYWFGLLASIWLALQFAPQTRKHLVPFELDSNLCDAPVSPWIIEHCSSRRVKPTGAALDVLGPTPVSDVVEALTIDPTKIYITDNLLKSLRHTLTKFPKEEQPGPEVFYQMSDLKITISEYKFKYDRMLKSISQVTLEAIPMLEAQIQSGQRASMWNKLTTRNEDPDLLWFVENVFKVDWYWDTPISSLSETTSLMVKQWMVIEKQLDGLRKKLREEDTQKGNLVVNSLEAISKFIKQANGDITTASSRLKIARKKWDAPPKQTGWGQSKRSSVLKHLLTQFRKCQADAEMAKRDLSNHIARQSDNEPQQEGFKPDTDSGKDKEDPGVWTTTFARSLTGICVVLKMGNSWTSLLACGGFLKVDDMIFWLQHRYFTWWSDARF